MHQEYTGAVYLRVGEQLYSRTRYALIIIQEDWQKGIRTSLRVACERVGGIAHSTVAQCKSYLRWIKTIEGQTWKDAWKRE